MATTQLTRQVIGWIEIDSAARVAADVAGTDGGTSLVAVFARWAGQGAEAAYPPASLAGEVDPAPAGSLPRNSSTSAGRLAHNAGVRTPRRSSRFPRRARADLAAISTDLEAQFAEFRRRMPAAS